jgi:hypothetical protein
VDFIQISREAKFIELKNFSFKNVDFYTENFITAKKSELLHLIARVRDNSRKVTLHILAKAFMQQQANIY